MVQGGRDSKRTVGPQCGLRLTSLRSRWAQRPRPVSSQEGVVTQSPHWRKGETFGGKGLLEQLRKEDRQSR